MSDSPLLPETDESAEELRRQLNKAPVTLLRSPELVRSDRELAYSYMPTDDDGMLGGATATSDAVSSFDSFVLPPPDSASTSGYSPSVHPQSEPSTGRPPYSAGEEPMSSSTPPTEALATPSTGWIAGATAEGATQPSLVSRHSAAQMPEAGTDVPRPAPGAPAAEGNSAPEAGTAIASQTATEDAPFAFQIPADAFSDKDVGETLTYSASLADGSPLPAWLSFDPATRTFYGLPENDHVGSLSLRVSVSDRAGASASQQFDIVVLNVNDAPTAVTVIADSTVFEDSTTTFSFPITAFADADVGDQLAYSATLVDGSPLPAWIIFDPTTRAFTATPDDSEVGSLALRVVATDQSGAQAAQTFVLTVQNQNEAPTVTSGVAATFAENATGTVYTATATDPDAGTTLSYSLSGTDAALFNINSATGVVTFKASPNFEAPADAGADNVYDITVTASDGTLSNDKAVQITVTNQNEGPTVTSGSAATFAENATGTVYTATATDPDAGTTLSYSLSGTDAALFNINSATGVVTFKASPNFEAPADAGGNNVYDITVTASDGTLSNAKAVQISVTNQNEGPTVTSGAAATFAENATGAVYTATATDPDAGTTLSYSLSGTDAALFNINSATGVVTFKASPNFEAPADAGADNVYDFTVTASDGTLSNAKAVQITVTNQNEGPTVTSGAAATFAENATGTVYTATATDPDAGTTLSYSLSGTDAALFNINSATGVVTFKASPNFEAPADAGGNNVYDITVTASDGTLSNAKAVQISVTNQNEGPTVTSGAAATFAENATGTVYTATATDPDAGTTLSYSLSGTDAALFNINSATGVVTFKASPNFEAPADAGADNVYDFTVTASDGTLSNAEAVQISVTNQNEGPTVTSGSAATFAENATGTVYTATATDPDAGTTLSYSLSGTDAALFNINSATGVVTFKASPNFEAPADAGADNVYDFTVTASDGTLSNAEAVQISVTNQNEGPTVTSGSAATFAENATGTVYTATATDPDAGTTLSYSLSGTDAALFNIDSTTGAVTFKASPNFEAPADAGTDNVYDITVTASDGTLSNAKAVQISVTNQNEGPTVTSGSAATFAENATGTVYTATATDPDAGTTLSYSLSGTDAALFNINSATGVVTFKASPNFEAPADAGTDNVYDITVTASDGTLSNAKAVQITVTNQNEGPTVTSGAAATFAENATGTVYTATATDPDAGTTLSYSLSGTDAALFNINSATGVVTFKASPNFEAPADAGADNVYDFTVTASDGTLSNAEAVQISVTNQNEGPTVTSGSAATFAENATGTVYTATATDPDAGTTLSYSLSGTDAALFNINSATGVVTFKASPNFEAPADAGGNNVYDITVTASDGTLSNAKAVQISVTNQNEGPTVTSGAAATFAENATGAVYTATATDPDAGTTLSYSLSGTDAALFNINSATGVVTFKASPNFEAPADAGADNVYDFTVTASDGTLSNAKAVQITVTNQNEGPTVTSGAAATFAENATGTVYTATATDPDAGTTLSYSLSGTDAALFNINSATGVVTFKASPNFEAPADAGGNNVYDITVTASDGTLSNAKAVQISVTNQNEGPTVTSGAAATFAENATGTVYTATATDPDAGTTLSYSLSGTDAALFNINSATGVVTFKASPNFEAPADAGADNVYDFTVTASDGTLSNAEAVQISVTNQNEGPTVTSGSAATFAENATGTVYTATATDPDAGTTLSYSLSGTDAALFNINSATGVVTFKASPNFEAPADAGADNVYDFTVTASDGTLSNAEAVQISVTNQNEGPTVTSGSAATFAENATGTVYTATATDPDAGTTLSYSLSGTDAALFNIDSTTGAVTFKASPNFEAPADAGTDNVYDITVTASDGTLSNDKAVQISVTNQNEGPTVTSGSAATFAENATGTVYTATATDPDAGTTLSYSLSGTDAALFNINSATGVVTFKASPNFEAPADAGTDNVYDITVTASDGTLSNAKAVQITVTNQNEGPTVTSGAAATFAENATGTVYTATATDPDAGTTLSYSLSGTDAALFNINSATGVVTFKASPNFEAPADAGADNVYDFTVTASDGTLSNAEAVQISVTNQNEGPTVTSGSAATFAENATGTVYTATATDPDAGTTLSYSLSGTDAALFNIDSTTGAVTFKASPNFEAPADAGTDNVYDITVTASDGTLSNDKAVQISVTNQNEGPTVTSGSAATFAENATGTVYTATATDPDAGTTLSYSLSGTDAALFNINSATGVVTFKASPNFEAPADAGADNVYDITVTASDGTLSNDKAVQITVTNVTGYFAGTSGNDTITGSTEEDVINATQGGHDSLLGGLGNDSIDAGSGNDTLIGGEGADSLTGGTGTDVASYAGSAVGVTVDLALAGPQISAGDASGDTLIGIENLLGSAHGDTLFGNASANVLTGGGGDDVLSGAAGNDTLIGGSGNDTLSGGADRDTADYSASTAGVTVDLTQSGAQVSAGDASGDVISGVENIIGSSHADRLIGDAAANSLSGGSGNDTLIGGQGADTLVGGDGRDLVDYSASAAAVTIALYESNPQPDWLGVTTGDAYLDVLSGIEDAVGSNFDDVITGDWWNDNSLAGGAGNDTLNGSWGADTLDGGTGIDTADYRWSWDGVNIDLTLTGTQNSWGDAWGDVLISIENVLGSDDDDTLTGDGGANVLVGNSGDDIIKGGAGADTLSGGDDWDTASYAGSAAAVTVDLRLTTAQTSAGDASGDVLSGFENLLGSSFDDTLTGDGGANMLDGAAGNDSLLGGDGVDKLIGGSGNDTLWGENGDDWLTGGTGADSLVGGAGTDTADYGSSAAGIDVDLRSSGPQSGGDAQGDIIAGVENVYGSEANDTVRGDSNNNVLWGNGGADDLRGDDGNDTLIGGLGADTLDGDGGTDTVDYSASNAAVVIDLSSGSAQSGGHAAGDILSDLENVIGSAFGDSLRGTTGANQIEGLNGNDTLEGGDGADTLVGGNGSDTASYASSSAAVTVSLAITTAQTSAGAASGDVLSGIENLLGSAHNDTLTGDGNGNRIDGGSGADSLYGGGGDDTLIGGAGGDRLQGDAGNDTADYSASGAAVQVNLALTGAQSSTGDASNDTLSGIENLIGSVHADTLTGDAQANTINGGAGNDTISGADGNDYLIGGDGSDSLLGGLGNDILLAENGDDTVFGGAGNDDVYGADGNDVLSGEDGSDSLFGGNGNDSLSGGTGNDTLTGSFGNDTIVGGSGTDWAIFSGNFANYTVTVSGSDTIVSGGGMEGTDVVREVEYLQFADRVVANMTTESADNFTVPTTQNFYVDGRSGDDTLTGGSGNDTILGGNDKDSVTGGAGHDHLSGNDGTDTLIGGLGDDQLFGGADYDSLSGGDGNDTVWGGTGDDSIAGGIGDDRIFGEADNDFIQADDGNDSVEGGFGSDSLYGGAGADTIKGDVDNDLIYGDAGADSLYGGSHDDTIYGGTENDRLFGEGGNDRLFGDDGNDTLSGGAGDDSMVGGAGSDWFLVAAGEGVDTISGGTGGGWTDVIDLAGVTGAQGNWTLMLTSGSITSTGSDAYTLSADAAGTINFNGGGSVSFLGIERIEW
jgi:Ca2+-binding RTX toxin-like protein